MNVQIRMLKIKILAKASELKYLHLPFIQKSLPIINKKISSIMPHKSIIAQKQIKSEQLCKMFAA